MLKRSGLVGTALRVELHQKCKRTVRVEVEVRRDWLVASIEWCRLLRSWYRDMDGARGHRAMRHCPTASRCCADFSSQLYWYPSMHEWFMISYRGAAQTGGARED